jgi:hypothetical protein
LPNAPLRKPTQISCQPTGFAISNSCQRALKALRRRWRRFESCRGTSKSAGHSLRRPRRAAHEPSKDDLDHILTTDLWSQVVTFWNQAGRSQTGGIDRRGTVGADATHRGQPGSVGSGPRGARESWVTPTSPWPRTATAVRMIASRRRSRSSWSTRNAAIGPDRTPVQARKSTRSRYVLLMRSGRRRCLPRGRALVDPRRYQHAY